MIDNYISLKSALIAAVDPKLDLARHAKIVNCGYPVLGVRTADVQKISNSVPAAAREKVMDGFFQAADLSFESVLAVGFVAAKKGDYESTRDWLKRLAPLFGSWAHPDMIVSRLKWMGDGFLTDFRYMLDSPNQYEVRTYLLYLFNCVNAHMFDYVVSTLKSVRTGEYYIDMAVAWLLAEFIVKQYDLTVPLLREHRFSPWIHNKAISKACDSFRVDPQTKAYLKSLKRN